MCTVDSFDFDLNFNVSLATNLKKHKRVGAHRDLEFFCALIAFIKKLRNIEVLSMEL
jgi:hypothetical protein